MYPNINKLNLTKTCLPLLIICAFIFFGITTVNAQSVLPCASDHIHSARMSSDKNYAKRHLEAEERILKRSKEYYNNPLKDGSTYTIPVVVHVVHNPGDAIGQGSNMTDQDIIAGVQLLNDNFANLNGQGVDIGIDFCLATTDPSGNPSTGITRYSSSAYNNICIDTENEAMKTAVFWDKYAYMNVWIVDEIFYVNDGDGNCNDQAAGYAHFAEEHGSTIDGVVMDDDFFDTSVFAHEVGHYLNLYHTFEGGCLNEHCMEDGDRVCDTPPDAFTFEPCTWIFNSCTTDVNPSDPYNPFTTDQNDMNDNYMDYRAPECLTRFTEGQKVRMVDALTNERASLLQNSCTVLPDIYTTNESVQDVTPNIGQTIQLYCIQRISEPSVSMYNPYPDVKFYVSNNTTLSADDLYLGSSASSIGTSDLADPEYRNYTVNCNWGTGIKYILFVADGNNEVAESDESNNVKYKQINVSGSCGSSCPDVNSQAVVHSFETGLDDWEQSTNDDINWTRHSGGTTSGGTGPTAAFDGNYYLYVEATNNFNKEAIITSPCFDISNTNTPFIAFEFHMKGSHMGDLTLDLYGNGQWYNDRNTFSGHIYNDWSRYEYNLILTPGVLGADDFKIRLRAKTGYSYQSDIAIDKVEVYDAAGKTVSQNDFSENLEADLSDFTVFPNPANEFVNLSFEKMDQIENVTLTDFTGKQILSNFQRSNENSMRLNTSNINAGFYIVTVTYDSGKTKSKKLFVQH